MSDVEVRVSAILEKIVDISVMEIGKIVGVSESRQPEESACSAEAAQKSSSEMVGTNAFSSRCRWCVDVPTSPACTAEHRNRRASELYIVSTVQPLKNARSLQHSADSLDTTNSSNLSLVSSKLRNSGEHSATGRHFELKSRHLLFYLLYVYRRWQVFAVVPVSSSVLVTIEPRFPLMHKFET